MEKLDLFGFPVEPVKQPKKKEPVAKVAAVVEPAAQLIELVKEIQAIPEPIARVEVALPVPEQAPDPEIIIAEPLVVIADQTALIAKSKQSVTSPLTKTAGKRGRKSFREMDSEADLVEVPEETILQQKLYYSISEVAGWFKVNTSLLRFWENEFDILQPRKQEKATGCFVLKISRTCSLSIFFFASESSLLTVPKNTSRTINRKPIRRRSWCNPSQNSDRFFWS